MGAAKAKKDAETSMVLSNSVSRAGASLRAKKLVKINHKLVSLAKPITSLPIDVRVKACFKLTCKDVKWSSKQSCWDTCEREYGSLVAPAAPKTTSASTSHNATAK